VFYFVGLNKHFPVIGDVRTEFIVPVNKGHIECQMLKDEIVMHGVL
jgi:hypothetical protein